MNCDRSKAAAIDARLGFPASSAKNLCHADEADRP